MEDFKDVLAIAFEETRKAISDAILKQSSLPPTYPSLGPVMFYLADSTTGCIHNWSSTTWPELKLGWTLRETVSPLLDVVNDIRSAIYDQINLSADDIKLKNHGLVEHSRNVKIKADVFEDLYYNKTEKIFNLTKIKNEILRENVINDGTKIKEIENLISILDLIPELRTSLKNAKKELLSDFDSFWETDKIDKIKIELNNVKKVLKVFFDKAKPNLFSKPLEKYGIKFPFSRIDFDRTYNLIDKLIEISQGRFFALTKFKELLTNDPLFKQCKYLNCNENNNCPPICKYIFNHPRLRNDKNRKNFVIEKWKDFIINRLGESLNESDVEILIDLFAFFPQEIKSSEIFEDLNIKLKDEIKLRKDYELIDLSDLSLLKEICYNAVKLKEKYKLYKYTFQFESIFYGGTNKGELNPIKNEVKIDYAYIIPIRFFNAQVKGQLVILSPDIISKSDCQNAVSQHYSDIQEAAKFDFYTSILEDIFSEQKMDFCFASALSRNLAKILLFNGLITWSGGRIINIAFLAEDKNISTKDNKFLKITFKDSLSELTKKDKIIIDKDLLKSIEESVNKEKGIKWDLEMPFYRYQLIDLNSDNSSNYRIFNYRKLLNRHDKDADKYNCNSALLINFKPKNKRSDKSSEEVYIMIFFYECFNQMKISAKEIVDTLFYAFIFEYPANIHNDRLKKVALNLHNHIESDFSQACTTIKSSINIIRDNNYKYNRKNLKNFIEFQLEPNIETLLQIINIYKEIDRTEISNFKIKEYLNKILVRYSERIKNQKIKVSIDENCNTIISGSINLYILIMDNLIRNSIEAFEEIVASEKIIKISFDREEASLIYEDNAGGIPDDKFYAQNTFSIKTNKSDLSKRGYGLFQSYYFAKSLGWKIIYEKFQDGSLFKITNLKVG